VVCGEIGRGKEGAECKQMEGPAESVHITSFVDDGERGRDKNRWRVKD